MPASRRVLIVDDEPDLCELFSIFLTRCGHDVRTAATAEAAIAIAGDFQPQTLLTDVLLGTGLSGTSLIRHLREVDVQLQVVVMSGESLDELADRTAREPGIPVRQKPFRLDALLRAIDGPQREATPVRASQPPLAVA